MAAAADLPSTAAASNRERRAARALGRFTAAELGRQIGLPRWKAAEKIVWMRDVAGCVRNTGERKKHGGPGRPAPIYEYVEPKTEPVNRPKARPPELEVVSTFKPDRGKAVARTGKRKKVTHAETRQFLAECVEAGCKWEWTRGGHIWIIPPEGERVLIASSPSDAHSIENGRADVRRQGVAV